MMTHEDYVSFEQAVKLKEFGFDWECNHYYHIEEKEIIQTTYDYTNHSMMSPKVASAPTLAQAQKWLREVKHIDVIIIKYANSYDYKLYYKEMISVAEELFDTYEQALLAGIDEILEFLTQN